MCSGWATRYPTVVIRSGCGAVHGCAVVKCVGVGQVGVWGPRSARLLLARHSFGGGEEGRAGHNHHTQRHSGIEGGGGETPMNGIGTWEWATADHPS